ncbi:MAG: hypothetical protein RR847_01650 [Bacilli bacterium]
MGNKAKIVILSIVSVLLIAAVAFEVYYFVFKEEPESSLIS